MPKPAPKSKTQGTAQPPQTSEADDIAYLKAKADRVLFLIAASVMPEEVKTACVTLLPYMSLDHVDRLISVLEEEITVALAYAKKHPEDEEFLLKLKAAKERYDSKVQVADRAALASLTRIESQLAQYE